MSDYKLISVESRKGGVGKTTAALNLGYLLKKHYHVLLLDIDITGTSIRAIQESRFWVDDTNLLCDSDGNIINLLQYYTYSYLKGKALFDFSINQEQGKIRVLSDSINVMASELYGDDASLLYDPSLLLDNLHVYWLTKLISSVCERFASCFNDEKPSVIILDNSPGFVGIGKAVHDILTDIGPEDAKFLTVSSLDVQDLESSLKAVYVLHQEYIDKLNGSKYPETQKGNEAFYAQLRLSQESEYKYYRNNDKGEVPILFYQGIIINKVSKSIVEGRSQYDFKRNMLPAVTNVFNTVFGDRIKDYLIPFDNVLLTQFYGAYEEKNVKEQANLTILKKRLNTIEGQIKMLDELGPDLLPYDLLRRADGFDKTIDTLKGALIACGYEVMAYKFNPDWSPTKPLRDMIDVLKEIGFASDSFELYVPRRARMQQEMEYYHGIASRAMSYAESQQRDLVWLASAVAAVACELSFCYSNKIIWNNHRAWDNDLSWDDSKEKWANMVNDALFDWLLAISDSYCQFDGKKTALAAYIISHEASGCDNSLKELFDNGVFVKTFKKSVSRLIDLGSDMQTMVNLIRTITINNEGSYTPDVDFVPFLNLKIIEKTYDYTQAKERMYSELRDSDYMAAYREVLRRVINQWGF